MTEEIVVVAGSAGLIGSAVSHHLMDNDQKVLGMDSKLPEQEILNHPMYQHIQVDVNDNQLDKKTSDFRREK